MRSEGHFAYLSTSARWEARRVRRLMQRWYRQYPASEQSDLYARLTSNDDNDFVPAFFELYLYRLFWATGYELTVHPRVPDTDKRPDFLARDRFGSEFHIEAVTPTEMSQQEVQRRALLGTLLDAVDRADFPSWFLSVSAREYGKQTPSGKRMKAQLRAWLGSLDPQIIRRGLEIEGTDALPGTTIQDGDWQIDVTAFPRNNPSTGRTIGSEFLGLRHANAPAALRDAIRTKATRYGTLEKPFLVAVNVMTVHDLDHHDVADALFGPEVITVNRARPQEAARSERYGGGALLGAGGPHNTRVSGVLVTRELTPWTISQRDVAVFDNPYAAITLPDTMPAVTRWRANGSELHRYPALHARRCLNVREHWPEFPSTGPVSRLRYAAVLLVTYINRHIPTG